MLPSYRLGRRSGELSDGAAAGIEEMSTEHRIARAWLAEMESCVREVNFPRCRALFAADVIGFGSKTPMVVGLDALERDQWRQVWPHIRNFTFLINQMQSGAGGDSLVWIGCPWTSERQDAAGAWIERPGRMTAVLTQRGGEWLAVHTHHSLVPLPLA